MYYGDKWDPSNDWSYDGLEMYTEDDAFFGNGNEKKTDKICVYADGVLVGGIEPDGSTPVEEEEVTTTKPPKTTTTTSKTTAPVATTTTTSEGQQSTAGKGLAGDANCDKTVNMADAVLIMQYIANPSKYGLDGSDSTHMTEQGKENADCTGGNDGVTNLDALAIQKYLLKIIDALPEIA